MPKARCTMPTAKPISQRPMIQKAIAERIFTAKAAPYCCTRVMNALNFAVVTLTMVSSMAGTRK
ncbi:hypothetical protein D3C81_2320060 [compost metagenome]